SAVSVPVTRMKRAIVCSTAGTAATATAAGAAVSESLVLPSAALHAVPTNGTAPSATAATVLMNERYIEDDSPQETRASGAAWSSGHWNATDSSAPPHFSPRSVTSTT